MRRWHPSSAACAGAAAAFDAAGGITGDLHVDGVLDEHDVGERRSSVDEFTQTDPDEGQPRHRAGPSVRVIAGAAGDRHRHRLRRSGPGRHRQFQRAARCRRSTPRITSASCSARSSTAGPDTSSTVNPSGARYDGLIEPGGDPTTPIGTASGTPRRSGPHGMERGDPDSDPARSSFNPDLREWHFNVQRRIQRPLETDRWAFPARQYQLTQTSRAGMLTGLAGIRSRTSA